MTPAHRLIKSSTPVTRPHYVRCIAVMPGRLPIWSEGAMHTLSLLRRKSVEKVLVALVITNGKEVRAKIELHDQKSKRRKWKRGVICFVDLFSEHIIEKEIPTIQNIMLSELKLAQNLRSLFVPCEFNFSSSKEQ